MALTKSDKAWVKGVLEESLGIQEKRYESKISKIEANFESKIDQVESRFESKVDEFKYDFYTKIDPILKEVVASREERAILSNSISDHSERLETIEKKLGLQPAI